MSQQQKLLIIIATYNECENIISILDEVFKNAPTAHILVIDDLSPDKTYELVQNHINSKYPTRLFLIKRSGKLGLGTAYIAGFNYALNNNYDIVMHMDADFSHNPKYIPQFLKEIKNADLVLGSRYVKGGSVVNWGLLRKIISKCGSLYSRLILSIPHHDLTGGFKCFRIQVLKTIDPNSILSNGYAFQVETTYRTFLNNFKIIEIPIIFEDRRVGQSKMSSKIFIEALFMIIKLRFLKNRFINKLKKS